MMNVVLVTWPLESDRLEVLRDQGAPRLVLVAEHSAPPEPTADASEDWVRLPVDAADVRSRVETLQLRSQPTLPDLPKMDKDGVVSFSGRTQVLPQLESRLMAALLARYGAVVGRERLLRAGWPGSVPGRNSLDTHMVRLRRRLAIVGLGVRTVRSRGYMLVVSDSVQTAVS
jgi:DNA-binding response OmpR family regulator